MEHLVIFSDHNFVLFRKLSQEKQTLAVLEFAEQQLYLWSHEIPHILLMTDKCLYFLFKGKLEIGISDQKMGNKIGSNYDCSKHMLSFQYAGTAVAFLAVRLLGICYILLQTDWPARMKQPQTQHLTGGGRCSEAWIVTSALYLVSKTSFRNKFRGSSSFFFAKI